MTADPAPRLFRPLAGRLVAIVVAVCAGCALLAIVVQGWQAWKDSERTQSQAVQEIVHSRMPALAAALWDIDTPTVQREVDEIARMPRVDGLQLTTAGGQRFTAGRRSSGAGDVRLAVPHLLPGGAPLGELTLFFDRHHIDELLLRALMHMVLGIALLATLTAVLLIRFLRRELTEPLHHIARQAHGLDPAVPAPPLELERPVRGWRDDIDLVAEAFNAMQASVRRHVNERDEALRELAAERDALDATVRERTSALVRLNAFLAHVTQLSARLIDLPPDRYPTAVRTALAELAQELQAGACALAETDEQGRWHWRFAAGPGAAGVAEGQAVPGVEALPAPQHEPGRACCDAFEAGLAQALGMRVRVLGGRAGGAGPGDHGAHVLVCIGALDQALSAARGDELRLVAEVLFGALARWHGLLDLERTRLKLLQQSRSDPLTGLANRRAFDERKVDELRRARRHSQPLTVMMVDIDHFKAFNDCYGHAAGDECLARVGRCLQGLFQRPFDCVARIGGEEFAVLLPDTTPAQAEAQGRRVLDAVAQLGIAHVKSPLRRLSVSLGATTLEPHGNEPSGEVFDRLMRRADEALYHAKAGGRNQIVVQPMA